MSRSQFEPSPLTIKFVRDNLLNKLTKHRFVIKIVEATVEIEELKNAGGKKKEGTLQKVVINNFPCTDYNNYRSWRINLENEVTGLSTSNRTVEAALAILNLREKCLNVYLIELKSTINDKVLDAVYKKILASISRFYFLLLLNDHNQFRDYTIQFKGVVFYNGGKNLDATYTYRNGGDKILQIFKNSGQAGTMKCQTVLGEHQIPVKFFSNNFDKKKGSIEISFDEISKVF